MQNNGWDAIKSAAKVKGLKIRNGRYYWYEQIQGKRFHESLGVEVGTRHDEKQAIRMLEIRRKASLAAAFQSGSDPEALRPADHPPYRAGDFLINGTQ